jgi:hypothetical protein
MDGTASVSCPMADLCVGGVEPSGFSNQRISFS